MAEVEYTDLTPEFERTDPPEPTYHTDSRRRSGLTYHRRSTYPSRFSEGKVHLYVWDKDSRMHFAVCNRRAWWHTYLVTWKTEVTCKKCLVFDIT